jgi:lysophospholipase
MTDARELADAAPLIATPQAPIPAGGAAEWFTGADGARLRAALFRPQGEVRGSVVLSGGRTEPIEKYFEVVEELMDRGFVVLVHDWRGQGLSHRALPDRLKGHAAGHLDFLGDYGALLDAFEDRLPRPWVALSHSMGGCLTLLALGHGERRFAAAALSAPMLGLQLGPLTGWPALAITGVMNRCGLSSAFIPGRPDPFDDSFEGNTLTHDQARFERHRAQLRACRDLYLGAPTWGWLDFAFTAFAWLSRPGALKTVEIPVLMAIALDDKIIDIRDQRRVATALPNCRLIEVDGAGHEILMETDDRRGQFWQAFDELTAAL